MPVYSWSQTAASNATADTTINWAEGQAPSSVNDSARAMMAAISKWRDDNAGTLVTGGTATAYTVSSNSNFSSLTAMDGQTLRLKINATNTGAATLNVDTLGDKSIVSASGTALQQGDLVLGCIYGFVYDNSNGVWVVHGGPTGSFPTGTILLFRQSAVPTGWTKLTSFNDYALRVVSGTPSAAGAYAYTTVFTDRTITQAQLPSYSLSASVTDPGHSHNTTFATALATGGAGITVLTGGGSNITETTDTVSTGISVSVSSGGGGAAFPMNVQTLDLILAQKN